MTWNKAALLAYAREMPKLSLRAQISHSHGFLTSLLAALYHDGNLVLFDPCQLAQVETDAQVLTCSRDGRILATGDAVGTIQVLEFESLNLIYKVIASDDPIRSLVFSRDNFRFIDIRGSRCNLWEPSILVHSDIYDDDSVSDTIAVEPTIVGISCTHHIAAITALAWYTNDELVFCDKNNGDITLYSTATGIYVQIMYRHAKGIVIKLIEYGTHDDIGLSHARVMAQIGHIFECSRHALWSNRIRSSFPPLPTEEIRRPARTHKCLQ